MGEENPEFGKFSGEPRAIWQTERGADRHMLIEAKFTFTDPSGKKWVAPARYQVDGTSIPRALWTLVGSPYTGDYRRASIVHDVQCDLHPKDGPARRAADEMFQLACRAGGCSAFQAKLLYLGVRIGSTWAHKSMGSARGEEEGPKLDFSEDDIRMQNEYRAMAMRLAELDLARGFVQEDPRQAVAQVKMVMKEYRDLQLKR